jgi:hypothetical protein
LTGVSSKNCKLSVHELSQEQIIVNTFSRPCTISISYGKLKKNCELCFNLRILI